MTAEALPPAPSALPPPSALTPPAAITLTPPAASAPPVGDPVRVLLDAARIAALDLPVVETLERLRSAVAGLPGASDARIRVLPDAGGDAAGWACCTTAACVPQTMVATHTEFEVPVRCGDRLLGALVLHGPALGPQHREIAAAVASHAGAALALHLLRDEAGAARCRLGALETLQRDCEDLHDNVIQRLFATGIGLQGLARSLPTTVVDRLGRHIGDLDDTIEEIRGRVFGGRPDPDADPA